MNKNTNKNKPHKHAELIKAWADGAKIQYWNESRHEWVDKGDPCWYEWCEYRVKPSNEPWKPKKGEKYYYLMISYSGFELYSTTCGKYNGDKIGIEMGNCFRTREEAVAAAERVKAALKGDFASDNNVARKEPELDGTPLTDGEKALIRALRNIRMSSENPWACGRIFSVLTEPMNGVQAESISNAFKQIQAEQEETDE